MSHNIYFWIVACAVLPCEACLWGRVCYSVVLYDYIVEKYFHANRFGLNYILEFVDAWASGFSRWLENINRSCFGTTVTANQEVSIFSVIGNANTVTQIVPSVSIRKLLQSKLFIKCMCFSNTSNKKVFLWWQLCQKMLHAHSKCG